MVQRRSSAFIEGQAMAAILLPGLDPCPTLRAVPWLVSQPSRPGMHLLNSTNQEGNVSSIAEGPPTWFSQTALLQPFPASPRHHDEG